MSSRETSRETETGGRKTESRWALRVSPRDMREARSPGRDGQIFYGRGRMIRPVWYGASYGGCNWVP